MRKLKALLLIGLALLYVAPLRAQQSMNGRTYPTNPYGPVLATPVDSPGAGTYGSPPSTSFSNYSSYPPKTTICWTQNGSTPAATVTSTSITCTTGTAYTGTSFTPSGSSTYTLKAIAFSYGYWSSATDSSTYTIAVICGENSQSGTDYNQLYPIGTPCTTGSDSNGYAVSSIYFYMSQTGSTSFDLGVYTNSSNKPSSLVCHTGTFTPTLTSGWNSHTVSGCGTLSASTIYWVGFIESTTQLYGFQAATCPGTSSLVTNYDSTTQSSAVLPNPFANSTPISGYCQSVYMVLQPQ
jgi:hypothetical protein